MIPMVEQNRNDPTMLAIRVHAFGGTEAMIRESINRPQPGPGQVLLRVEAAGVGPWDAWVRSGRSKLPQPLPLTLGADLCGTVEKLGAGVTEFKRGAVVFGITNSRFTGAYAEYALAEVDGIAAKPRRLTVAEAASIPVVACTAWQMVFDHGRVDADKTVLVQGAAGNVGAYAVQLAKRAGARVFATAANDDMDYVFELGADEVIDANGPPLVLLSDSIDVVLDTAGGSSLERSFDALKQGGVLVSCVAPPDPDEVARRGVRAVFFLVEVNRTGLEQLGRLFDAGELKTHVGEVLPLRDAALAHEMLAGRAHKPGKIVLLP